MSLKQVVNQCSVTVPIHLQQYVVEQDYSRYTAVDQAVWRYVMRQNSRFLERKAHPAYLEGLRQSGIGIETIPKVEYMNDCLSRIGWGAVTVDGFIPPSAFMDFQAHRILAIATDIRTLDHVAYTPAPDIIHESAGHAPIILDGKYRSYLQLIGEIGAKAFSSKSDLEVYEAIRHLSIVKENPHSTEIEIRNAEDHLEQAVKANTTASEAARVSRLYWWTVEYGLLGDLKNPLIYGAGLLSSVGESESCLKDDVRKIPFDLTLCVETDYDITKPQPQLFVCESFDQLIEAVNLLSKKMAFHIGGTYSLQKALESSDTATVVYSSGLQVTGTISHLEYNQVGEAVYLKTQGPTVLAYKDKVLPGHGRDCHKEGFGSPIGLLTGWDLPLEQFTEEQLQAAGIQVGEACALEFSSGVEVRGLVQGIIRKDNVNLLISFKDCKVTYQGRTLFQSEWGPYDMAAGAAIASAYPGAADKDEFADTSPSIQAAARKPVELTPSEQLRNTLYQEIRDLRESLHANKVEWGPETDGILLSVHSKLQQEFPTDWLLRLEILEILGEYGRMPEMQSTLRHELKDLSKECM